MSQAWLFTTMGGQQQYAGNRGYDDDPHRVYRYDSNVANHKQVAADDFILIREDELVRIAITIVRIERDRSGAEGGKKRDCNNRETAQP